MHKSAIADYNKILKLNPSYTIAYNNRGIFKRELGNYIGTIRDINKALKMDSKSQLYINNLNRTKAMFEDFKYEKILNPSENKGYLVFADIRGWKGIWQKKHFNANDILKKIKTSLDFLIIIINKKVLYVVTKKNHMFLRRNKTQLCPSIFCSKRE